MLLSGRWTILVTLTQILSVILAAASFGCGPDADGIPRRRPRRGDNDGAYVHSSARREARTLAVCSNLAVAAA